MNNQDFSNIEKIAVSTSVATIADFATYQGEKDFSTADEGWENLKGAVMSFAVSAYFAKNDNISDWIGSEGTFGGDMLDFTTQYIISDQISHIVLGTESTSITYSSTGEISLNWVNIGNVVGGFIGSYIGYQIADSWIDTKNEATGAAIGSTIGAASSAAISTWAAAEMGMHHF